MHVMKLWCFFDCNIPPTYRVYYTGNNFEEKMIVNSNIWEDFYFAILLIFWRNFVLLFSPQISCTRYFVIMGLYHLVSVKVMACMGSQAVFIRPQVSKSPGLCLRSSMSYFNFFIAYFSNGRLPPSFCFSLCAACVIHDVCLVLKLYQIFKLGHVTSLDPIYNTTLNRVTLLPQKKTFY